MQQHAYENPPPQIILRSIVFPVYLLCLLLLPFLASAATINLSPGGSIQQAVDAANPGDTIYLHGGTYSVSSQINISRDGSSGNLIKLWTFPGEHPVLDASGFSNISNVVMQLTGANWWHIKGLEIKNGTVGGIRLDGSNNNIIENVNSHHHGRGDGGGTGIRANEGSSNNLFLNNDSHDNLGTTDPGGADGFSITSTTGGNIWRGNRAWHNSDDGYDTLCAIDNATCAAILIENNWAIQNGWNAAHQNTGGDGEGFKLGGVKSGSSSSAGGHTVRNNLAYGNRAIGFADSSHTRTITLYNNTGIFNGGDFGFGNVSSAQDIGKNNLGYSGGQVAPGSGFTYNSWQLPVTVNASDFQSTTDLNCLIGPRQADGSLPVCRTMRLVAGSDLIDKGTNVGIPFTGSAPDLGAFEFCTGNCPAFSPPGPPGPGTPPPPPAGPHVELTITPACFANAEMNAFALAEHPAADSSRSSLSFFDLLKKNLASVLFFWR